VNDLQVKRVLMASITSIIILQDFFHSLYLKEYKQEETPGFNYSISGYQRKH
jgi:hypothetical protein